MQDNWRGKGGWKGEVMEGGGGNGRGCFGAFILICFVPLAGLVWYFF